MDRVRYAALFCAILLMLTTGAVYAFGNLGTAGAGLTAPPHPVTISLERPPSPVMPTAADHAVFAAEDRAWRARHARTYSLAELRARGDGRRTPRQAMQDEVFALVRAGDRGRAIARLERWTAANRRDREAGLWLARLLRESGRTEEALGQYRRVLVAEASR